MEESKNPFKTKDEDPGFLVAKGRFSGSTAEQRQAREKDHKTKLATAIYMAVRNHGYATVRAIGTHAIANAVRSIAVATERCHRRDIVLAWELIVERGNLGPMRSDDHVQDVTAYCFRIESWKDLRENENDSDR